MIRVRIGPPHYPFYAVLGNYNGRGFFCLGVTAKTEVYCQINCVTITARIGEEHRNYAAFHRQWLYVYI